MQAGCNDVDCRIDPNVCRRIGPTQGIEHVSLDGTVGSTYPEDQINHLGTRLS